MRNTKQIQKRTAIGIIIAVAVVVYLINACAKTVKENNFFAGSNDPDRYDYGIPFQHVVDIHYIEIGQGLTTEPGYPVYETTNDGWIIYTVRSTGSGDTIKEVVFNGPEFWDEIQRGKMADTTNWENS